MAAGVSGKDVIQYYDQFMNILSTNPDLRKRGINKQAACGGTGALIGAVFGGPVGAFVGSIAGSAIGYMQADGYDSMINVLMKMSDSEKQRLVQKVQELVGGTGIEALTRFIGDQAQREVLLHLIQGFAKNPLGG